MDGGSAGVAGAFTCLTGDPVPGKGDGGDTIDYFSSAREKIDGVTTVTIKTWRNEIA